MTDDSSYSAAELRRRYHKGGSANDDELTAAQVRASIRTVGALCIHLWCLAHLPP
jgi:hypothetical protein